MRVYAINKLCWMVLRDHDYLEQVRSRLEEELARLPLSAEERTALLDGDVLRLFQMGVHPYLMGHVAQKGLFGLTRENYLNRLRDEQPAGGRTG